MTEHKRPESSVQKGFARADWNARYAGSELIWSAQPNRLLVSEVAGLEPGRALDLACGEGRNAVWLAESCAAFESATSEKSTPVVRQPCSASHTALRPSPQARSSARPGSRRSTSEANRRLGSAVQSSSEPA